MAENIMRVHCIRKRFDSFLWKIPNISSLPQRVNYFVESESFSWGDSSFSLKLYPCGQTEFSSAGFIDVIIERQHQSAEPQTISVHIFCVDIFNKKVSTRLSFLESNCSRILKFMRNLNDDPERWKITPNDTLTVAIALSSGLTSEYQISEDEFEALMNEPYTGNRIYNLSTTGYGEIFGEVYESFDFRLCREGPDLPIGYQIAQKFSFANAVWILKMYPYFGVKNLNKQSLDMVLERLQSKIPEHHFNLEICFGNGLIEPVERFFVFDSHHTIGDVLNFRWKQINFGSDCQNLQFKLNFRMEFVTDGHQSNSCVMLRNTKFLTDFQKLFLQEESSDVTINVKGQEFPAHKVILMARSPVLAAMFQSNMKEKATGILDIKDCDPLIFETFLYFLYCGEVPKLSEDNVFNLHVLGDKYDVPDLRAICKHFIRLNFNLSVDTFCDIMAVALKHSDTELIELSRNFFKENLQEIIVTAKWKSFLLENPIQCNELLISALVTDSSESCSKKRKLQ